MPNKILKIITIENKRDAKFLRQKTANFDFKTHSTSSGLKYSRKEIAELIKQMREAMRQAQGVGLSANQVGLDLRFFVAQIPQTQMNTDKNTDEHGYSGKFYTIFNPEIIKFSKEKDVIEEGCLSVPEVSGLVQRPEKITLIGQDKNGKKIKIKAWGILARIFQHEIDHLNGILFIDRTKKVYKLSKEKQQIL